MSNVYFIIRCILKFNMTNQRLVNRLATCYSRLFRFLLSSSLIYFFFSLSLFLFVLSFLLFCIWSCIVNKWWNEKKNDSQKWLISTCMIYEIIETYIFDEIMDVFWLGLFVIQLVSQNLKFLRFYTYTHSFLSIKKKHFDFS